LSNDALSRLVIDFVIFSCLIRIDLSSLKEREKQRFCCDFSGTNLQRQQAKGNRSGSFFKTNR
jgi:hypothetical protein